MVRRRLSLPFTDVKEDNEVIADEEINNSKTLVIPANHKTQGKLYQSPPAKLFHHLMTSLVTAQP